MLVSRPIGEQLWNGARARWTGSQFRLRIATRFFQVDRVRGRTESELYSVVSGQQTRVEFADLFLNEMPVFVAEPNLRDRGGCDDNQVVVYRRGF